MTAPGSGASAADAAAARVEMQVAVVTVSDRCSRGESADRSGPLLVELLTAAGYAHVTTRIVPDGVESVRDVLTAVLADGARLVLTTGGTGVGPRDLTPEGTATVVEQEIPGIPEAIRRYGASSVPAAVLSRGIAGIVREAAGTAGERALVVNLPGSTGGVRDGWAVLEPLLGHVFSQLDGGDH